MCVVKQMHAVCLTNVSNLQENIKWRFLPLLQPPSPNHFSEVTRRSVGLNPNIHRVIHFLKLSVSYQVSASGLPFLHLIISSQLSAVGRHSWCHTSVFTVLGPVSALEGTRATLSWFLIYVRKSLSVLRDFFAL